MRRLALLVLALGAIPASAQDRFVEACVVSAADSDLPDPARACQCAADAAVLQGVDVADLDAIIDHLDASGNLDASQAPPEVQVAAVSAVDGLLGCAFGASPAEVAASSAPPTMPGGPGKGVSSPESAAGPIPTRFVQACTSDPGMTGLPGISAGALCECIAAETMGRGVSADVLNRSVDYRTQRQVAAGPPEIRLAAGAAMQATTSCVVALEAGEPVPSLATPAPAASARRAPLPRGLRTGNGQGPVQTRQAGAGAAIRVVG